MPHLEFWGLVKLHMLGNYENFQNRLVSRKDAAWMLKINSNSQFCPTTTPPHPGGMKIPYIRYPDFEHLLRFSAQILMPLSSKDLYMGNYCKQNKGNFRYRGKVKDYMYIQALQCVCAGQVIGSETEILFNYHLAVQKTTDTIFSFRMLCK